MIVNIYCYTKRLAFEKQMVENVFKQSLQEKWPRRNCDKIGPPTKRWNAPSVDERSRSC